MSFVEFRPMTMMRPARFERSLWAPALIIRPFFSPRPRGKMSGRQVPAVSDGHEAKTKAQRGADERRHAVVNIDHIANDDNGCAS